jgi:RNA 3'-terminal phosphate cyclase (ATP)
VEYEREGIEINGSQRSGSGTIVRDAVPFSILTHRNLHLTGIRASRPKPGLRPQHLAAIRACTEICQGQVHGAAVGSREITMRTGESIAGGRFFWDIGTAGSAVMLAMSVILLGIYAPSSSRYRIRGGLFQDFSPTALVFLNVFLPTLREMHAPIRGKIIRPGYVPRGGGEIEIHINPRTDGLMPLSRPDPGRLRRIGGVALSSHLRLRHVSERMAASCEKALQARGYDASIQIRHDTWEHPEYENPAVQPGACLAIWGQTDTGCIMGADMAGARGRSAERIGIETAERLSEDLGLGATVDRHLADQVIPFAALARGWSSYRIPRMTDHIESRLWLVEKILGARTEVCGNVVRIQGIGYGSAG